MIYRRAEWGSPESFAANFPPNREIAACFGQAVRRARRAHDLSQEMLAAHAGVSTKHLSDIERGVKEPRLTTVMRLAIALDLSVQDLLADMMDRGTQTGHRE